MKLLGTALLLISLSFPFAHSAPPCSGARPQALCARYIRPYSDNAYTWQDICEFTAPSNVLIADNVERYDIGFDCDPGVYFATCCAGFGGCANGIDCDGPLTDLPPVYNSIPTGWTTAVACAVDNAQRVLANPVVTYLNSTTPYSCVNQCIAKGYQYAGLEYGDECYCGTGYAGGVLPPAADVSECNMRCAGLYSATCGGSWRMQIYKANGAP
ncbi:WSC-domain-containing protein [Trametopsis cervina]|nr:WSC-domain-containing protein [Trametopsis cervina]